MKESNIGESSNDRTPASDAVNEGLIPSLPANYYWCYKHKLDIRWEKDHRLHENDCKHFNRL